MRLQNLTALFLFLALNLSECVYGAKRNNYNNKYYNTIPDKKLNEGFKSKMEEHFSPDVMRRMMNLLASNNKIRAQQQSHQLPSYSPSSQLTPIGDPLAELDKSLFDASPRGIKPSALSFFKPASSGKSHYSNQPTLQYYAQPPPPQQSDYNTNPRPAASKSDENMMHMFHRWG